MKDDKSGRLEWWRRDWIEESEKIDRTRERNQMNRADWGHSARQPFEWRLVDIKKGVKSIFEIAPSKAEVGAEAIAAAPIGASFETDDGDPEACSCASFRGDAAVTNDLETLSGVEAALEVNAISAEARGAVSRFATMSGLDAKATRSLEEASEAVATKVANMTLPSRVRNSSAYVARIVASESRAESEQEWWGDPAEEEVEQDGQEDGWGPGGADEEQEWWEDPGGGGGGGEVGWQDRAVEDDEAWVADTGGEAGGAGDGNYEVGEGDGGLAEDDGRDDCGGGGDDALADWPDDGEPECW